MPRMQVRTRTRPVPLEAAVEAIASPRRRQILRLIWGAERSAGEIASSVHDVSWPAVSQNLRVLKIAGLITERRQGTHRYYKADRRALPHRRRRRAYREWRVPGSRSAAPPGDELGLGRPSDGPARVDDGRDHADGRARCDRAAPAPPRAARRRRTSPAHRRLEALYESTRRRNDGRTLGLGVLS